MLSLRLFSNFIFAAIGFWIVDALIVCLSEEMAYLGALFGDVSQARLIFRLIVVLIILVVGFMIAWRKESSYKKVLNMGEADRALLYGNAESSKKSQRLLFYALRLAALMKMTNLQQDDLRKLCYCYDIGLVGVHTYVQKNAANLNDDEQEIWNKHIELGTKIASCIPQLKRISRLISCHEEYYDGSGYKAMRGKNIPLACRIFTVVMMFDYFTHPHGTGVIMDNQQALDEMDMYVGSWLDPDVMEEFHSLFNNDRLIESLAVKLYWQS